MAAVDKQHVSDRASPRGRRPRANDSEGRERLLDVAIGLFAERGIANTTVAQIATAGQVTSAMVHYWFDTREKLLDAVVDERVAPMIHRIWDLPDAEPQGALERVRALLSRMFEVTKTSPWLPSLWLREIVQEGGLLRERALSRIPQERSAAFRRDIASAQARGEINPQIAPEVLFFSMLGLVMLPLAGARSARRFNPGPPLDREKLERHVVALLTSGLTGAAPARRARSRRSDE